MGIPRENVTTILIPHVMLNDSGVTVLPLTKTLAKIKLTINPSKTHATSIVNRLVFTRDLPNTGLFCG